MGEAQNSYNPSLVSWKKYTKYEKQQSDRL
jgi:hypothetical protein